MAKFVMVQKKLNAAGSEETPVTLYAPTSLAAVSTSSASVYLTWNDTNTEETGYTMERATDSGFTTGLTTFNLSANSTYYTDSTTVADTTYYYRLKAFAGIWSSSYSSTVSITPTITSYEGMAIGIPDPGFGISDTMGSFHSDDETYYTYYIDNEHPSATDTANTYGTAETPRLTLPNLATLVPGDVVEIHGTINTGSIYNFTVNGTEANPIFIRGEVDDMPVIRARFDVRCSYIYFENLIIDQQDTILPAMFMYSTTDNINHIVVRNCEIRHYNQSVDTGGNSAMVYAGSFGYGYTPNYIVIYGNYIHDNGNYGTTGRDIHAVLLGDCHHVWVLENEMHDNAADSVQVAGTLTLAPPQYIYIGRNEMHDEGENCVDLKRCMDVVISENIMYNIFAPSAGASGTATALTIHMGYDTTLPKTPLRVLTINNLIHDCRDCACIIEGDTNEFYFIGNVCWNIGNETALRYLGVFTIWSTGSAYIWNNSFLEYHTAIRIAGNASTDAITYIENNIFMNGRASTYPEANYQLYVGGYSGDYRYDHVSFKNNLLYNDDSTYLLAYGSNYTTLASFVSAHPTCTNNAIGNPNFSSLVTPNLELPSTSPAKENGIESIIATNIESAFGISDIKDINGTSRPQTNWDIGAYEY